FDPDLALLAMPSAISDSSLFGFAVPQRGDRLLNPGQVDADEAVRRGLSMAAAAIWTKSKES
ncbi:hypothetical protein, partial [Bradyrhizobium sp. PRIMUS42]|uniref:hypothetical protein n=1 Tax=Bradyrhizobium sp. PRIMUS42 TaxID=2908926 RepID=UPI001FF41364